MGFPLFVALGGRWGHLSSMPRGHARQLSPGRAGPSASRPAGPGPAAPPCPAPTRPARSMSGFWIRQIKYGKQHCVRLKSRTVQDDCFLQWVSKTIARALGAPLRPAPVLLRPTPPRSAPPPTRLALPGPASPLASPWLTPPRSWDVQVWDSTNHKKYGFR